MAFDRVAMKLQDHFNDTGTHSSCARSVSWRSLEPTSSFFQDSARTLSLRSQIVIVTVVAIANLYSAFQINIWQADEMMTSICRSLMSFTIVSQCYWLVCIYLSALPLLGVFSQDLGFSDPILGSWFFLRALGFF